MQVSPSDPLERIDYRPPEMRLFELAECRLWMGRGTESDILLSFDSERDRVVIEDARFSNDPNYFKVFLVKQFFATTRGFLEVDIKRHRLDELTSVWSTFAEEFNTLKEISGRNHKGMTPLAGDIVHTVEAELWTEFTNKWYIHPAISFNSLAHAAEVLDLLSCSEPKIQQLCLTDLPEELLDKIMSFATLQQARSLSGTCKQLHRLGQPYVFWERLLWLPLFDSEPLTGVKPELQLKVQFELLLQVRERFMEDVDFLLSRPDILRKIRRMEYSDENMASDVVIGDTVSFYPPVYAGYILDPSLIIALSQLSHLRQLSLHNCRYNEALIISFHILPRCSHVRTLEVWHYEYKDDALGEHSWLLLFIFPHIRVLNVRPRRERYCIPPPPPPVQHLNVFNHLRFLCLFEFYELPTLSNWIRTNRLQGNLSLTHLKLTSQWGQSDDEVIDLLEALRTSPLEVLLIDGLRDANLILFQCIAEWFPGLRGLSLIRRDSNRQLTAKAILEAYTVYPIALLLFEQLALGDGKEDTEESSNSELQNLISATEETGVVDAVRLLTAYVPTLKIVATIEEFLCAIEGRNQSNPSCFKGWKMDVEDVPSMDNQT
ncbi:hypothetical protein GYMLUDRAFT_251257 [Collybiopsis luxurians FD-317 M1]|uniref:F-box domain-containing protein n=1 Tax=Collybiopsis luxurians FD-317 M1 TaxID=944289 RepID=A0A0D0BS42_9AGAR|nr:hypothetical protein GYMLUDRAFT_251257 [Collybiopsis luxurians FD-317 M1]